MISNEIKNELNKKASLISQYLDIINPGKDYEYFQLEQIIMDLMSSIFRQLTEKCNKEEKEYIINKIRESKSFHFGKAEYVALDNNRTWFTDDKDRENLFFERYSRYLQSVKNFKLNAINDLSKNVLDPLMNQLGDPKTTEFSTHGLVMGDVQSGKTMTYIGLLNKAVDAGYKLIIILTGTIESLRKQTQERIDLGFTGFDSDSEIAKETKFIGVGLDTLTPKGTRFATSFTTKVEDFNSKLANGICTSLDLLKGPAIMVIKKNVKILEKISDWLIAQHGLDGDKKIKHPILMIDDEADNASINTNDEDENPTRTNAGIRRILNLFDKYSYVGFTATPYANIFIDPDNYDKELGKDLFPSDFIFSLLPSESYIGGKDIFLADSKYKNALINNDDCGEVLPSGHKKYHPFNVLPKSLKEAIILFALSNCIRDLRDDLTSHRAMLINISRFTAMHYVIQDVVQDYFNQLLSYYFNFSQQDSYNSFISLTKNIFEKYYFNCKTDWDSVRKQLYKSNEKVQIMTVNKDSEMINYKEYEEDGARVIFIGGLSLSRGLTLEGLVISYFYRYSKTYDVLFQMGRWFGYRPGYEDLFRIYMPTELMGWYSTITESMEELKHDLTKMSEANKKPIDYGIRIQNDTSVLKLTTASKMKSAVTSYKTVIGFGEIIPTPDIFSDVLINKKNIELVSSILEECISNGLKFEVEEINSNKCVRNVPFNYIQKLVDDLQISSANDLYEKSSLTEFLNKYKDNYFKLWDIVVIEGSKKRTDNIFKLPMVSIDIHITEKDFDSVYNYIRLYKSREQLHNPQDTSSCMNKEEYDSIVDSYKKVHKRLYPNSSGKINIPAKRFLDSKNRKPLIMLYFIDLKCDENDNKSCLVKEQFENAGIPAFGIAISIPKYEDTLTEKTLYKINLVEQRRRRELEYNYQDDDSEEEV